MQALQAEGDVLLSRGDSVLTPLETVPPTLPLPPGDSAGERRKTAAAQRAVRVAKRKQGAWTFLGGFLQWQEVPPSTLVSPTALLLVPPYEDFGSTALPWDL